MRRQFLKLTQSKARLRRGDTLIEVIISFAILGSVITIVTTGALNAWRAQRLAAERTQATALAQRQADALKAYRKSVGWSSFYGGVGSANNSMSISGSAWQITGSSDASQPPFTQNIKKTCVSAVACEFIVSVTWQSAVRPAGSSDEVVQLLVRLSDGN